jgi:aminoglycoside phosphotransferase
MFREPLTHEESWERAYYSYPDRFLKRSLAPSEYKTTQSGEVFVPFRNRERLENEVACLKYIREETDIPIPEVFGAYGENGSFLVWTARVEGVPLKELKEEDRLKVLPEIRRHIATLQTLRSNKTGGPSGILCPPYMVTNHCDRNTTWRQISAKDSIYVFCHGDLSGSNIIVDPVTYKVVAILDWEYAGYYPKEHEIPYYERPMPSGAQPRYFPEIVKQIKQFWEDSACRKM